MNREAYDRLWHDPTAMRQYLQELLNSSPELFPAGIEHGFQLTGRLPESKIMRMLCRNNDDRLFDQAREHAARQAETQRQMTDLHKQVAEGSRRLVESDAKARAEVTALQHDLQADQAAIGRERDRMEAERRELAAQRHRDPIVAAIILDVGIVLACLLPLGLGVYVLWSARRAGESDSAVADLLVQELTAAEPRLLPPDRAKFSMLEHQTGDVLPDENGQEPDRLAVPS